jgi:hypothetical protein
LSLSVPNILLSTLFSNPLPPSIWVTKFHSHTQKQAKFLFCMS